MTRKSEMVAPGTHVEVELVSEKGKRERLEFDIVPDRAADFSAGLLSEDAPLAKAIMGQTPGSVVAYKVGDLVEVKILGVAASKRAPSEEVAEKREQKLRQALSRADLDNAISFALTFDSKWGDYDPEGIASNWDDESKRSDDEKGGGAPNKDEPPHK